MCNFLFVKWLTTICQKSNMTFPHSKYFCISQPKRMFKKNLIRALKKIEINKAIKLK